MRWDEAIISPLPLWEREGPAQSAGRVRGVPAKDLHNPRADAVAIVENLIVPEAQDAESLVRKKS